MRMYIYIYICCIVKLAVNQLVTHKLIEYTCTQTKSTIRLQYSYYFICTQTTSDIRPDVNPHVNLDAH